MSTCCTCLRNGDGFDGGRKGHREYRSEARGDESGRKTKRWAARQMIFGVIGADYEDPLHQPDPPAYIPNW